jgi:tetratricopeptide (TPR) repeat protein
VLLSSTLVLSLGLSWLPASALALPNDACIKDERCKEHHDKAVNYYNQQYFEEALSEFQAAYAARQMPLLLINIGRTLQKLGRPKEAISYYERFQQAESKPDPAVQAKVTEYLNQAKALVGTEPTPPPTEHPGETPKPPTAPPVPPAVVPPPPPPPPAPPPPGRGLIVAGGVLAGIGVLGLVTGLGLYAKSASDYSTFQNSTDEFDQLAAKNSAQAFGAGSTASYAVGAALVGVGAVLIGVGARKLVAHRRAAATTPHAALLPGPSGVTAVLTGAF